MAKDLDETCRRHGGSRGQDRRRLEEQVKLQYFFGGRDVAYMDTAEGLVVVAVGELSSEAFGKALEALSRDERRRATLYSPDPWNTPTSSLLTPFADE